MELSEFRDDILNRVRTRAAVEGVFMVDAFTAEAAEMLREADEMDSFDSYLFTGTGRRGRSLAVNGFREDEQDRSVSLVVTRFFGGAEEPTLSYTDAATSMRALAQYLQEALSGEFVEGREPSAPEYQLARTLEEMGRRRGERAISRYRLYLVTDGVLSSRAKAMESTSVEGVPVEHHIWDIARFLQVQDSVRGREPLVLDLTPWDQGGVPALKVADQAGDITTYLAALPGKLLSDIYNRHGSRLLEGNVRSFLTIRGKINRGIRETVVKDPAHFLAYNNGISATASDVTFEGGRIRQVTDLQIVNGGQTTASLFYATQSIRALDLADVFVQMKLVVVSTEEAVEMVPLISRFANSQNAVREDDFFSSSPFHIRMEELSKKLLAPAKAGIYHQTKWFYERTRGQYLNDRSRRTASERKKFEMEFPRKQVITKTDAAKYAVAWDREPHMVSAGAQKNFKAFATLVGDSFVKNPERYNENYYRRLVAKAILFNSARSAISKADWYEAGYLANLTAYAIAKLSLEVSRDERLDSFDLLRIWERQSVGEATMQEVVELARFARDVLTGADRLVVNVTEWAKKPSAWERLAAVPHELSREFVAEWLPVRLNAAGTKAVTVSARFEPEVPDAFHVQDITEQTWRGLRSYLQDRSSLTNGEQRVLRSVTSGSARLVGPDEARTLLATYVKALNHGWSPD